MKLKSHKIENPNSETLKEAAVVLESATQNADALRAVIHSHYEVVMNRKDKEERMVEIRSQLKKRQDELEALNKKK
jgi:hypothetical protein